MIYYFVEFAGSFANIALLVLFVDRLFQKKDLSSRWYYLYIALLIVGQCTLSLFPTWVMPRTIYLLLGGFLLAMLFYEAQIWQAIFASAAFFHACSSSWNPCDASYRTAHPGYRCPNASRCGQTDLRGVLESDSDSIANLRFHTFFSRKKMCCAFIWLLPIIAIQIASITDLLYGTVPCSGWKIFQTTWLALWQYFS